MNVLTLSAWFIAHNFDTQHLHNDKYIYGTLKHNKSINLSQVHVSYPYD